MQKVFCSRTYWGKTSTEVDEILDGRIVDEDQIAGSVRRKGRSGRSEYLDLEEDHSQSGGNEREIGHDFVNSHQPFTPQNGEQAFQHSSSKDDVQISESPLKIQASEWRVKASRKIDKKCKNKKLHISEGKRAFFQVE
ncbi:uncharacterized protein LOC111463137 [Cucurbita moschata]|uniref:Uncharacterized protein LOC111463137 n=1 Tax=Cucurbita moschata TaxID=3662 RepID=A0A6J1HFN5_CUCMO|nr:uncharacterized protein LOC111463137 [Cucurbita moschata]